MKDLLDDIFGDSVVCDYHYSFIGDTMIIELDTERRVMVTFTSTTIASTYDAVKFSVVSKITGNLVTNTVTFKSIFKSMEDLNHVNKLNKHIWDKEGSLQWFGKPTIEDIEALEAELSKFISIWK